MIGPISLTVDSGQPGPVAVVRFGIQLGQLPSQAGATPERKVLVVDDVEGEAGQDRCQGRDPRAVRHVSDGRGGHSTTAVQDHPSPDLTTRCAGASADMTKRVFAGMETTQNPMGRSARIRTNSTDGRLQWLLLGRE